MTRRSAPTLQGPAPRSARTPVPMPGRQEIRRSSTRRELLIAGRRLFGSEGIFESRIEDITERAGIAKGTLYLHFSDKEDLLHEVTREGLLELRAAVLDRVGTEKKLAPVLTGMFLAHLAFFEENRDLMRILHQVRGALKFDRAPWRRLRTLLRLHVEFLADNLARGEARGWTPARRRALAALLFGMASGSSSVQLAIYPDSTDLNRLGQAWATPVARALLEISAHGARGPAAGPRRARRPT